MTNITTPRSNDRLCNAEEIFKVLPHIIHHFSHSLHTTRRHASLARNTDKGNQFGSYAQIIKYSLTKVARTLIRDGVSSIEDRRSATLTRVALTSL